MKRVIVDVDAGVDDVFALLLLLFAQNKGQVKIEAITCVRGNTDVENVYKNVKRIFKISKRNYNIPVYLGSNEPLVPKDPILEPDFFGKDGFGDLNYDDFNATFHIIDNSFEESSDVNEKDTNVIIAISEIVMKNPGEISLICLGPLTNIALAMKVNPIVAHNLKEIFIMGGNYLGGEDSTSAEFNFQFDAEAAFIVLSKAKCPITILPKETCEAATISYDWRFNVIGSINAPIIILLNEVEKQYSSLYEEWITYDPYLVATFLDPSISDNEEKCHARVELVDAKSRAKMVIDSINNVPNVSIITKLNQDLFKMFMNKALIYE